MAKWTADDIPSLAGKVAVVTGANSGLGFNTALQLARHGAQVVLACRGVEKAQQATADICAQVPGAKLEYLPLDLADLDSVRAFAELFKSHHKRLDILCNNAGVMALPLMRTRQGFEMQIGTNHLGHFALTGQLLEVLKSTPGARVMNVASLAHRWTLAMDLADINWERKPYKKWDAYGKSKLANLLFTFELQRRLRKANFNLISVAAHPGYSSTNLQFAGPVLENSRVGKWMMKIGNGLFGQSAAQGALPSLYAATMPDVQSGEYFGPDGFQQVQGHPRRVGCRRLARDEKLAADLWTLSEKLTGVTYL